MNTDQLVQTFCEFVAIDSPTGEEKGFSDYLCSRLRVLGVEPVQDARGNILVRLSGEGAPLLLAAHIDTVEPGRGIVPQVHDGIITSAGDTILGADNKAVVSLLFELIRLLRTESHTHRALEILFSVSEEAGISGIDTFDFSDVQAKEGLCIDAAQPVGTVILSSPFYLRQEMTITGIEADASTAERGRSILPALTEFLQNVPQGIVEDGVFCNIGVINGGSAINAVLSSVHLRAEVRSFQSEKLGVYAAKVREALEHAAASAECTSTYEEFPENDGYAFTEDEPFIAALITSLKAADPDCVINFIPRYWGISDANNLNRAGIRTLNIGYGATDPHTVREAMKVKDLETIFAFIQNLVCA